MSSYEALLNATPLRIAFELRGDVDIERLERSCLAVINRHPALRMRLIREEAGVQRILPPLGEAGCLQRHEVASQDLRREVDARSSRPLDLYEEGPIRFSLFTDDMAGTLILVVAVHHIASDIYGNQQIGIDLWRAYSDDATSLSDPGATFLDYIAQEQASDEPLTSAQRSHLLDTFPKAIALSGHGNESVGHDIQSFSGVESLSGGPLAEFAESARVTKPIAAMTLLVGALSAATGESDFPCAVIFHGRMRPADREVVGLMLRHVYFRTGLEPCSTYSEAAGVLYQRWLEAVRLSTPMYVATDFLELIGGTLPPRLVLSDGTASAQAASEMGGIEVTSLELSPLDLRQYTLPDSLSLLYGVDDCVHLMGGYDRASFSDKVVGRFIDVLELIRECDAQELLRSPLNRPW